METQPYRWRLSVSFLAHLWKGTTQQHHRELIPLIGRLVPADAVVFDVGAHAGQFTKLFARAASRGRVYAFEPSSYARSILRSVVWLHGLRNVAIVPVALGADLGLAPLTMPIKASGASGFGLSHLGPPEAHWRAVAQELVAQATIDDIADALRLDRLDFIKADIEGWELQMLRGARAAVDRFRPRLMLELTSEHLARAGDRLDDVFEFLAAHRYRGFSMAPDRRLVSVAAPAEGDFWFLQAEDALIVSLDGNGPA
jgi:FkbM family methyltransferase